MIMGALWGKNLYGPIMFIDRASRRIVANMPDKEGLLKGKDGVFTGVYPKELLDKQYSCNLWRNIVCNDTSSSRGG